MFERRIPLFSLFGFKVGVDITWFILAVLVTWSLAAGLFPYYFEGFSTATYWWMGVAGALGLFISIIFHEFCHSIVARQFGMPMKGITLFIFGGVAEMTEEPPSAKAELLMAAAGPASSVVFAGILFLVHFVGRTMLWPAPVNAVVVYLVWLNIVLAIFNMIPAFPLDGGRVLRSILWAAKKDLRWATRIASRMGSGFGIFLTVLGVISFIGGNFIGGLWYFLIGMFIRGASQSSYREMLIRQALAGEHVERFMKSDPVVAPPSISIRQLVEDYFYRYHYKMFPVSDGGRLEGCVSTKDIKDVPRSEWDRRQVAQIAKPCSDDNTVAPQSDATEALATMNRTGNSRLMVVKEGRLTGIITLKDLLKFLAIKLDLEEGEHLALPQT
ncbi:MAG TPA: site-2 protease family protein [Anaerohalosphaeraceae bacterium]|jgi:Zn-dependent protease/predicted transcriptional regulator|nr:site-2 protease family protein [Anaerohalosphaeraceae bacterium]HRT50346.1 site-2 protease family protein [Anaerohalosphaeraceae bacterium]HRT86277.1 site-2 protease family protein [Anaerohalosphaeraceae bacterium]